MLKVKVLIIFFGTPVFSARMDGRYRTYEYKVPVSYLRARI